MSQISACLYDAMGALGPDAHKAAVESTMQ